MCWAVADGAACCEDAEGAAVDAAAVEGVYACPVAAEESTGFKVVTERCVYAGTALFALTLTFLEGPTTFAGTVVVTFECKSGVRFEPLLTLVGILV